MHRGNYSQSVKLLANNTKSLVAASKSGLSFSVFAYELAVPFENKNFKFT